MNSVLDSARRGDTYSQKIAAVGGSKILPCNFQQPPQSRYIIQWRKRGIEVPVFLRLDGLEESIDAAYEGRIKLLDRASIQLSDIRKADEGHYECSVINFDTRESTNITTIYLHVDSKSDTSLSPLSSPLSVTPRASLLKQQLQCTVSLAVTVL